MPPTKPASTQPAVKLSAQETVETFIARVVAAGTAYGQHGEGFIRISLTVADKRLEEAMERIKKAFGK